MPNDLLRRTKQIAAQRKTTMRMLVIDALERTLDETPKHFHLRDASTGNTASTVNSATINAAIDEQRKGSFTP